MKKAAKHPQRQRRLIQVAAALFSNAYLIGLQKGSIFQGKSKAFCLPGLNCYSCPAAISACPIGALSAVAGSSQFQVSFYVLGLLLLFGVLLGRAVCGFLCLGGLIQELLYKIPLPKLRLPAAIDRPLRYLKYLMLLLPVLLLPALLTNQYGIGTPYFCQWVCPLGTLEGGIPLLLVQEGLRSMIGFLFYWKFALLGLFVLSSIFIYRPFCKYICPLGALYGLLQRFSLWQMRVDSAACSGCGHCEQACPMQVEVRKNINSAECIRCGACKSACQSGAIRTCYGLAAKQKRSA